MPALLATDGARPGVAHCRYLGRPAKVLECSGRVRVARVAARYGAGGTGTQAPMPPPQRQAPPRTRRQQQQQYQQTPAPQQPPAYQQPYAQQQYQQQQQRQPPMREQQGQARAGVPPRRRPGAALPPQQAQSPTGASRLQQLSAQMALQQQVTVEEPAPTSVQRGAGSTAGDIVLPRSLIMDKEIITRTSGNRLGYVNEMFVDPASLSVASLYLRQSASRIAAPSTAHVMLASLRQISDVILVHDDNVLMDPPADDSMGYCRLVGALVVTQTGQELGKVRDFLFDPDTGAISTIKYDRLGIPVLPQALFSCYSISWEDVVALGPTKLIVKTGTETRALKENEGIADVGVGFLVDLILGPGPDKEQQPQLAGTAGGGAGAAAAVSGSSTSGMSADQELRWRSSPEYRAWYEQFGRSYEAAYGKSMPPPLDTATMPAQQQQQQQQQRQRQAAPPPRALPPPQSVPMAQALQQQPPQRQYQQQYQQQRQAVPAGAGGSGASSWGAPPPPAQQAQQFAFPPQQAQRVQGPSMQFRQAPQQQQQYDQYQPQSRAQQSNRQQQQQPQGAQQPPAPRQAAPRPSPQQPLPPQNGIPIIDRTPLPPYRRRDIDGNYGMPPAPAQQAPGARQQAGSLAGGTMPRPQAPRQQQQQQAASPPQVVEPDAVIPGGVQQLEN